MRTATRKLLSISALVLVLGISAVAQSRIQLVQGRRLVKDKLSFVVDVGKEKPENPRYANAPEDIQIFAAFANQPATGLVYVDAKAIGRFDDSMGFNSNPVDITYGRHTITFEVSNGATLGQLYVTVRGGRLTEILDAQETNVASGSGVNDRIAELERRVQQLENEIAALKKKKTAH
jgi:hypothetical protein